MSASECPICTHTPFSADMCVPAKGLQMTIKAFIKTERKKRGAEAAVLVEQAATTQADTSAPAVGAPADTESAAVAGGEEDNGAMKGMDQVAVAEPTADTMNKVSGSLHITSPLAKWQFWFGMFGVKGWRKLGRGFENQGLANVEFDVEKWIWIVFEIRGYGKRNNW